MEQPGIELDQPLEQAPTGFMQYAICETFLLFLNETDGGTKHLGIRILKISSVQI